MNVLHKLPFLMTTLRWLRSLLLPIGLIVCSAFMNSPCFAAESGLEITFKDGEDTVDISQGWDFYWNELLEAGDRLPEKSLATTFNHPDGWNSVVIPGLKDKGPTGFGTYRKVIRNLKRNPDGYQIGIQVAGNAYKIIAYPVDHPELADYVEVGKVSRSQDGHQPSRRAGSLTISPKITTDYVLLVQAANFDYAYGGFWLPIKIDKAGGFTRSMETEGLINLVSVGVIFSLGIYSLMLWFRRRSDLASLALMIFSVFSIARLITTNSFVLGFFNDSYYSILIRIEYISMIVMPPSFLFFLVKSFSQNRRSITLQIMSAIVTVLSILTFVLSVGQFSGLLGVYMLTYTACTSICLIFVTWAALARKAESSLALIGTVILSAAAAFDYGVANYQIANFYVIPLASAFFLAMLSQLVAKRSADAYRKSEILADELMIKNREVTNLNQNLERLVDQKTEEIRIQSTSMKLILDSINEGIIKINQKGMVEAESSAWAFKFFEIKAGAHIRSFIHSLEAPTDVKEATLTVLESSLGDSALQWEINSSIPLQSALYKDRNLSLLWHPIIINDHVSGMVITAIDETERLAVERLTKASEERAERLLRKARILLKGKMKVAQAFLNDLPRLLQGLSGLYRQEGDVPAIMRNIHTIKGGARSIGMNDIRDIAHNLENIHKSGDANGVRLLSTQLEDELKEYQSALRDVIGMQASQTHEHVMDIVYGMQEELRSQMSGIEAVLGGMTIRDELGSVPPEVKEILLHGLTNAMDHGFILPARKGIKIREAHVKVEAYRERGKSILKIKDNGIGMDWKHIDELCQQKGFSASSDRPKSDVLFLDGVSTAAEVSLTSGRGVGLSAIRAATMALGGVVSLLDNEEGPGSMLLVEWQEQLPNQKNVPLAS